MRLESNSQTAAELSAVLEAHGFETETTVGSEEVKVTSVPDSASPGESPSGTEEGKPAPAPEAGKPKKQEPQAAPPVEPGEPKPNGQFEPRRKQLERKVERLHEDLDLERGSKAELQTKLEKLQAELAALKPVAAEPKAAELVEPKWPTRAEHEYDDDKYEAAIAKYHADMRAYNAAMVEKTVNERIEARDKAQQETAAKAEADRIFDTFVNLRNEQAAKIEGYQELLDEVGDYDLPEFVRLQIIDSPVPAHLIHHFNKDQQENQGKDLARLARLNPVLQVRELTRIETRLAEELAQGKNPAAAVPVAAAPVVEEPTPKPVAVPAKPKIKPEEAPLEPLGGRGGGRTPTLADAKSAKEYIALRNQNVNQ